MQTNVAGARKKSKAGRYIAALLYPFIITAFISLFVLPGFLHCIDTGNAAMSAGELASAGDLKTKNITITGYPLLHDYICIEETNLRYRTSSYTYFVPVTAEGWTARLPISCVLQLTGKELDELEKQEKAGMPLKMQTVVRNTLWEGIDDDVKEALQEKFILPGNIILAEYGSQSSFPLWLCGSVFAIAMLGSYQIIKGRI